MQGVGGSNNLSGSYPGERGGTAGSGPDSLLHSLEQREGQDWGRGWVGRTQRGIQ